MQMTMFGRDFEITAPYAEGHTLTAAEAAALNQTRRENIGNQLRKALGLINEDAARDDAAKTADMAALVAARDAEYTFGLRAVSSGPRVVDPVQKEARAIARDYIASQLAAQNRKLKDVDKEKLEAKIAEFAATDKVRKLAEKRVRERQSSLGDLGDIDLAPAEATAAE